MTTHLRAAEAAVRNGFYSAASRYPTPTTVWTMSGLAGSASIVDEERREKYALSPN